MGMQVREFLKILTGSFSLLLGIILAANMSINFSARNIVATSLTFLIALLLVSFAGIFWISCALDLMREL